MKIKHPTYTGLVFDYLVSLGDFAKAETIAEHTRLHKHQVNTSLAMLRHYKAVEPVDNGPELWWMATPDTDTRFRRIAETSEHKRKCKPRKKLVTPVDSNVQPKS